MALDKIDKIKKISGKLTKGLAAEPNKDHFQALMNQRRVSADATTSTATTATSTATQAKEATKVNSLFDEVRDLNKKADHAIRSTPKEFVAQTEDVIAQIDTLKNKLETPDLQLKSSVQTVLRDKLTHIDENLKIALSKTGVEYIPPEKATTSLATPIERFLGLLTHSQSQLMHLSQDVQAIALDKENRLTPATMLLLQMKVGYIQQEIELFTNMLSKALESTKTIMNVQV
jgi:hypothetical protein